MSVREEVLEDVLQRIAEERGVETMALGWEILDQILENDEASRWSHVIVHHSFTEDRLNADTAAIRRFHTSFRQGGNILSEEEFYEKQEAGESGLVRPWKDIGYHWLIEKLSDDKPTMIQGRSMMMHGAHCREQGMNRRGIGVCVVGNFDAAPPSEALLEKAADSVAWLCRMYRIPLENIHGHREFATYKSCPGKSVRGWRTISLFGHREDRWTY
jgi:hypothetical protein